jgi:signal transduction histidine kinase
MNEDHDPPSFEFIVVLPWFKDPRLLASLVSALAAIGFFAGLAFNRHRKLVQSYAEVEQIVAQRTRELQLAHEELLHSQKMKALGTFAAGIAHDFNNILSIIKGSAQIIEGNIEDKEKIRTRVSRIRGVVDQGAGIVRAMLGYSRSGNKEHASYELNSVIEQTLKFVGDRFPRAVNIRVESNLASPQVYGSKDLMQQMLLNLILNAAEAIPKQGEIVLRCGSLNELPPELVLHPAKAADYVFLGVEDSGSGIAPDLLPRIFEPFFTTKELSTKRGTGLGLYMVYEFAKEMGYGLMVGSTIGKGTTFTIIIPIRSPAASG